MNNRIQRTAGYSSHGKARQVLGIRETQIVEPVVALRVLSEDPTRPVLLLDDFVGSGMQAVKTWQRLYEVNSGSTDSFASAAGRGATVSYTPIVATEYGMRAIHRHCAGLTVRPGHVLNEEYSLVSNASVLWPPALRGDAPSFLFEASQRAGIVEELGSGVDGIPRPSPAPRILPRGSGCDFAVVLLVRR